MLLTAAALVACGWSTQSVVPSYRVSHRAVGVLMVDEPTTTQEFELPSAVTRSRMAGAGRTGSIVVTDGTGSFYNSRSMFTSLYDFGGYARIVASSPNVPDAKKMLISRSSRYSGLLDALEFHDSSADAASAFEGAESWLAVAADEAALPAQIDAAAAGGVTRAFVLITEGAAASALSDIESRLSASGMTYTLMRTGDLVSANGGSGLKLGPADLPMCESVPKEDVLRFVTEALTLPEASGRAFSLCPSTDVEPKLKQMRLCGYGRRDEVQAILGGALREDAPPLLASEQDEAEPDPELVMRSAAELAAEREEELKMLLERARKRGEETQARMAYEEKEKAEKRKEAEKYYSSPDSDVVPDTAPAPDDTTPSPTADADEEPPADAADEPPKKE